MTMMEPPEFIVTLPGDKPDLTPFIEANEKKVSWDQRLELIRTKFPSTVKLDWFKVFKEDPALLGRIINDILKVDQAAPGKPGKRPAIEAAVAENRLRQLCGDDFTAMSFQEAFKLLCGERSIRNIANKCGLDRNHVHRLLKGTAEPTGPVMEKIARAFKKEPGYFFEYRLAYIFGILYYKLADTPEMTVGFYRKLQRNL